MAYITLYKVENPKDVCIVRTPSFVSDEGWDMPEIHAVTNIESINTLRTLTTVEETTENGVTVYNLPNYYTDRVYQTDDKNTLLRQRKTFWVERGYYGKSHAYVEDCNAVNRLFATDDTRRAASVFAYMGLPTNRVIFVKTIFEADCKDDILAKRFYRGTRSYYLAFSKTDADRLIHDMIGRKAVANDDSDLLATLKGLTSAFVDGETFLEIG